MRLSKIVARVVCIGLIPAFAAQAVEDKLPKAEKILDRFVEVTGGKSAYQKIHSQRVTGKMTISGSQGDIELNLTSISKAPNLSITKLESDTFGELTRGYDGKLAWEIHPFAGNSILEGKRAAAQKALALFNAPLNWRAAYKSVETVGIEDLDGKPAFKVKLVSSSGSESTGYYAKKSGLLLRVDRTAETSQGPTPVVIRFTKYKETDGVKLASQFTTTVPAFDQTQKYVYDKIENNVKFKKDAFDLPSEIKELLAAKKDEHD